MKIAMLLLATLPGLAAAANVDPPPTPICETLEACLALMRGASGDKGGIDKEDGVLVDRVQSFGPAGVPGLVEMLADPNESAAELAGYALRDTPHIDVAYLPEVKAGLDRGLGWLAPALCRMEGDEVAREAVARFLVSKSAPHNQEAYALKLCGRRALPHIVEAARCRAGCPEDAHSHLASALADMGEVRLEAAPGLFALASEEAVSDAVALGALTMLATMGPGARSLEHDLLALRTRRPALREVVDEALVGIGSGATAEIFRTRLVGEPDRSTLQELAASGSLGRGAGSAVIGLLAHEDWDLRVAAARTLGFIGYREAMPALVRLLDDPHDVRLNWAAAESLGRLQLPAALPPLHATGTAHWNPAVRAAAATAVARIEQQRCDACEFNTEDFFSVLDQPRLASSDGCEVEADIPAIDVGGEARYLAPGSDELVDLAFDREVVEYLPESDRPPDDPSSTRRRVVQEVPSVALRVEDGWLLGSDRGEWGGELMFRSDDGMISKLVDDNVADIRVLGGRIVAITGLAHMMHNTGTVYSIERDRDGRWSAARWRALAGAPSRARRTESGSLFIEIAGADAVLLEGDGSFQAVPCATPRNESPANSGI